MSKTYFDATNPRHSEISIFLSFVLFLALIIGGWGLSMRNAEASSSALENVLVESTNMSNCQRPEATDGLVKFKLAVGDTLGLDFRKNDGTNFQKDGNVFAYEWRKNGNTWIYMGYHYKPYYAGQNVLQVTHGTDQYEGVYYQTWWKSSVHNDWTYTGEVYCYF